MKRYQVEKVRFKPFKWDEVNQEHRLDDAMKSDTRHKREDVLHKMKGKIKVSGRLSPGSSTPDFFS